MNRMSNNTTLCSTLYDNYHANIKKVHQIQLSQYYLLNTFKQELNASSKSQ